MFKAGVASFHFVVEWVQNWVVYFFQVEKKVLPGIEKYTKVANVIKDNSKKCQIIFELGKGYEVW